jgi:hypothetical protein
MSLMEAVARVAGEPHSYRPKCASPVIGDFLDTLEFCSNAEERQKLKRFIPKLIGTAASDAVELRRSWMALDWTVRVLAPACLRLADSDADADADALEALAEIDGILTFKAARDTIREACVHAEDAWRATWDPATDWDEWNQAVWVGFHGAWEAARTAADDVWLKDADYALDATLGAAATVWSTAGEDGLRPTRDHLQREAMTLAERMIAVTSDAA